ncbi:thermonuclease family protein [Nitrosospira multiformis]|uniref:thermonuclease family protein n=1 Tax=Nitrosospira multiformis TaxID=1231 RepID=UPI00094374A4
MFGKTVAVEWHKQDRYQRVLGKVVLNGQDINLEQIKAGWHGTTNSMTKTSSWLIGGFMPRHKSAQASKAMGYGATRRLSPHGISGTTSGEGPNLA